MRVIVAPGRKRAADLYVLMDIDIPKPLSAYFDAWLPWESDTRW
jgi:hypothetical protein